MMSGTFIKYDLREVRSDVEGCVGTFGVRTYENPSTGERTYTTTDETLRPDDPAWRREVLSRRPFAEMLRDHLFSYFHRHEVNAEPRSAALA